MRIALVHSCAPFVYGGAEFAVDNLYKKLIEYGHQAELFRIPFLTTIDSKLIDGFLVSRLLKLDGADRVIAFKFPAYCIAHPNKVLWLFHQFRQVYDLWNTEYGLAPTPEGQVLRESIMRADNLYIPEALRVFTNSREVMNRLRHYNGIESEVLPPPLQDWEKYYCEDYGDYFFLPSRITNLKRQHLAIESMKFTKTDVKLIIAGKCDEPLYLSGLQDFIRQNGLEKKITFLDSWISQEEKIRLMANALAGIYIPYQEDSCGFVTMEAFYSCKPVITCTDSGGTSELVVNGITGLITPPDPEQIASAMDRLYLDREKTKKMGQAGYENLVSRNITWEHTVERLTE